MDSDCSSCCSKAKGDCCGGVFWRLVHDCENDTNLSKEYPKVFGGRPNLLGGLELLQVVSLRLFSHTNELVPDNIRDTRTGTRH